MILPAEQRHVTGIVALRRETFALHRREIPDHFVEEPSENAHYDIVRGKFPGGLFRRKPSDKILVWEDNGDVAGFVMFTIIDGAPVAMGGAGVFCFVEDIGVVEDYRRSGVAEKLLEELREHASQKGCDVMTATIWAFNDASRQLFGKLGFTEKYSLFDRRI